MRQWRVGSLSMGLLLIGSGIGLLYAQFNRLAVMDLIVKWWPLIFILLGAEILLQTYLNKGETIKIKYDVFSIFMVLIIILTGLGLYSAGQVGLIDRARTELNSRDFAIQKNAEIAVENGITQIILETSNNPVKVETSASNSILVHSTEQIRATSRQEANAMAAGNDLLWQKRSGNTLYLGLNGSSSGWSENTTVVLPENINVEIDLHQSSLVLNLASPKANWTLNEPGNCSVQIAANADLLINTISRHADNIGGNLAWSKATTPSTGSRPEQTQAQSTLGKGTYKLNIINADDLDINRLP